MGASITLRRRLEWLDTDAAVRWHHATIWRYAEAAEAELHRRLGISDRTFGFTPRRRVEAEFHAPVAFDDEVTIAFEVAALGRTSVTYEVRLSVGERGIASARVVAVFVGAGGRPRPWPGDVAAALRDGVPVAAASGDADAASDDADAASDDADAASGDAAASADGAADASCA